MKTLGIWNFRAVWALALGSGTLGPAQVSVPPIHWQWVYGGTQPEYVAAIRETADGGLVLGVTTYSQASGNKVSPSIAPPDYWVIRLDAQGDLVWEKTYGGSSSDFLTGLVLLADGSILVGGESESPISGNKSTTRPYKHAWLLCLDDHGEELWEQSLGGIGSDSLYSMNETRDGGAIIAVSSRSETGDDKSAEYFGESDFWIVRLNARGEIVWDRAFGGSDVDYPLSIRQTSDGGFITIGLTQSDAGGNKALSHYGSGDYWVLRLDAQGNKLWESALGGTGRDEGRDAQETVDGGFMVFGTSNSGMTGNKSSAPLGESDYWIVKLNAQGHTLWDRVAGGTKAETLFMSCKTWDGGFLVSGFSTFGSIDGTITSTNSGLIDEWIVRLDQDGQELWQQHFGGSGFEQGGTIAQTKDGGYAIAIMSGSNADGNKALPRFGELGEDAWVIKTGPDVVMLRSLQRNPSQVREEGFRLQLSGPTNAYAVEYSTNLTQWELLQHAVLTNNAMEILDPAAINAPRRIYRARGSSLDAP